VVYGQKPPSVLSYLLGTLKVQEVDQTLTVREDILCTRKENLAMAQNRMKQQADQGRSERQFAEGSVSPVERYKSSRCHLGTNYHSVVVSTSQALGTRLFLRG
jgi:hypothetical protein